MHSDVTKCKITPLGTRNANYSYLQCERLPQKALTAARTKDAFHGVSEYSSKQGQEPGFPWPFAFAPSLTPPVLPLFYTHLHDSIRKKTTPSNILNRGSESPCVEHTIALHLQSFSRSCGDVSGRRYNYPFFSNLMSHSEAGGINTSPSRRAVGLWASAPAEPQG